MAVAQPTIADVASKMSCDAMKELSKSNYVNNLDFHMYALVEPPCELAFGFADRRQEHLLQKGAAISRNVCIEKLPAYQRGPWESVFVKPVSTPPVPMFYDKWTRSRLNSKCNNRSFCQCADRLKNERFI